MSTLRRELMHGHRVSPARLRRRRSRASIGPIDWLFAGLVGVLFLGSMVWSDRRFDAHAPGHLLRSPTHASAAHRAQESAVLHAALPVSGSVSAPLDGISR